MQLNPLHDRVVVKRIDSDAQTSSGIIIPDNAQETPDQGVVLAIGQGRRKDDGTFIPLTVNVDDKVLFGKYAGQAVKIKGEEVLVLSEDEIYATIEE
jgi:chaperonin GroES